MPGSSNNTAGARPPTRPSPPPPESTTLSATGPKTGRLVILAGPSCVGKSPLAKALARFYPELSRRLQPVVLYNSRTPRPGESDGVDYHFRSRSDVEVFRREPERYVVMDVRGDLQALDLTELDALLAK